MSPRRKLARLKEILARMDSVVVAFSGGADSSFLLKVASDALPRKSVIAVTADSLTYPKEELENARCICRALGLRHTVIRTRELENKKFVANSSARCYYCKKELFSSLERFARLHKLRYVVDASNLSDKNDFRPGSRAKEEHHVRSPLQEAGFTKEDVRRASRQTGLATWNKPSLACLASRVAYGIPIQSRLLSRIHKAEGMIRKLGIPQVRVRDYGSFCRIEVLLRDIPVLLGRRKAVVNYLKRLGYSYVNLDLEGYRSGSMNIGIRKN